MTHIEEVIKALRCSSAPAGECKGECKYRTSREIEIEGIVRVIEGCDCDRIAMDAAELLEEKKW